MLFSADISRVLESGFKANVMVLHLIDMNQNEITKLFPDFKEIHRMRQMNKN